MIAVYVLKKFWPFSTLKVSSARLTVGGTSNFWSPYHRKSGLHGSSLDASEFFWKDKEMGDKNNFYLI